MHTLAGDGSNDQNDNAATAAAESAAGQRGGGAAAAETLQKGKCVETLKRDQNAQTLQDRQARCSVEATSVHSKD